MILLNRSSLVHLASLLCLIFLLGACSEDDPGGASGPVAARPTPAHTNAALTISPDSGYAGTYINLEGSAWPADAVITIMLSDKRGHSGILVAASTDANGRFTTGFLYPLSERWLAPGPYGVIAQTASGEIQAQDAFTIVPPADVEIATPLPTNTPTVPAPPPSPTTPVETPTVATPVVETAPSPTVAPADTPVPTSTPTLPPAVVNQPPVIEAALVPVQVDKDKGVFAVMVSATDPENELSSVEAIIETRRLDDTQEVKLKQHPKKIHIKWNANKLEIQAPDPEAILAQLRQWNGIPVSNGQQVTLELTDGGEQEFIWEDDPMKIKAPAIILRVTAQDAGGLVSTVSVVPQFTQMAQGESNPGDGEQSDDNEDDEEKGKEKKDKDKKDD